METRKEYPEDWEDTIRPRILTRDGYRCKHCGVRHRRSIVWTSPVSWLYINDNEVSEWKENGNKAYKVYLQVAHLDNNKQNCSDENLIALCNKCHLRMDRRHSILMRISNLVKPQSNKGSS